MQRGGGVKKDPSRNARGLNETKKKKKRFPNVAYFSGSGELNFRDFCGLASRFMEEDTDTEAMQEELREAFRLYDKEGNGYITTDVFRDILHELDDALSPEELDMIIEEVDTDGSGTLDFEGTSSLHRSTLIGSIDRLGPTHGIPRPTCFVVAEFMEVMTG